MRETVEWQIATVVEEAKSKIIQVSDTNVIDNGSEVVDSHILTILLRTYVINSIHMIWSPRTEKKKFFRSKVTETNK